MIVLLRGVWVVDPDLFLCVGGGFFFFKQKTAYEMRISDWSSDVCSSDLCFGDAGRSLLAFDHSLIAGGQWWRLITGSYVHLGWYHLMLNEIGLLVLVLLCPQPLPARIWLLRLFVISLGMGLCLFFFVPDLTRYVGMRSEEHTSELQ